MRHEFGAYPTVSIHHTEDERPIEVFVLHCAYADSNSGGLSPFLQVISIILQVAVAPIITLMKKFM